MSPIARGVRTFAAAMVGVLGAVVVAMQASDYKAGLVVLTLGVATAFIAGLVAFLSAQAGLAADTALGKAIATFCQFVAAGLATVTFASLTDLANFGHVALPLLVAGLVAAAQTFVQNVAEGTPVKT
jgi:hypothetical protein